MKSVLGDEAGQVDSVHNDSSLSSVDKIAKTADIHKATHSKIANVLSPDQLTKWDAEMAKVKKGTKIPK